MLAIAMLRSIKPRPRAVVCALILAASALAPADDSFVAFPDADTRAQLRRATEATDALELQPCQRRDDYVLRYTPK
jgi:hypothetical protein